MTTYAAKKKTKSFLFGLARAVLVIGICFVILAPLLEKLSLSFKSEIDLYDPLVNLIPRHFTLYNYLTVFEAYDYPRTLLNTSLLCAGVSLLTTLSATMVGYGFAKFPFKLNRLFFVFVLVSMIIPPQTYMMSQYLNMKYFSFFGLTTLFGSPGLNLTSSPASLLLLSACCSGIRNGFFIFIMRQYFRGFPDELYEAAAIDGAGQWKIFVRIMLPAAVTMMVTVFLFMFVWQWNDTYFTNMLTGDFATLGRKLAMGSNLRALGYDIQSILPSDSSAKVGMLLITAEIMTIAPLIVLYLFGQKSLTQGVERSGLVG